jgi:hypothetical protein
MTELETTDLPSAYSFRVTENIKPGAVEKDCVLFYHPSCEELAEKVAEASESITLGQIDWR